MNNNDLKRHEFENDIQRFMQIRDQVHDEIKKIGTHVATLEQTNKRLVAHFDVFKELSKTSEEQIKVSIKTSAQDMARASANQFSQLIEDVLRQRLMELDRSVQNAQRVLNETMGEKYRKVIYLSLIGCTLFGLAGFGGGYFYSKRHTYAFPSNFLETYVLGLKAKAGSLKVRPQEQHIKKK